MGEFMKRFFVAIAAVTLAACQSQPSQPTAGSPQPSSQSAPITAEAIASLQQLQGRTEIGINLAEYRQSLGQVQGLVNQVPQSDPDYRFLNEAAESHRFALALWQCKLRESFTELQACRNQQLKGIFARFTAIENTVKQQVPDLDPDSPSSSLDSDAIITLLWIVAGENVAEAAK